MKSVACILLSLLMLSGMVSAEKNDCDHHYKLYHRQDGAGYYTCLCTQCEDVFAVYPTGFESAVPIQDDEKNCNHLFRKVEDAKQVSIEPASDLFHEVATWYDCICERCGLAFEAYETDGRFFSHEYGEMDGDHVEGMHKHFYAGYCMICGVLGYDIVDCMQYEDGRCMGGYDYIVPVFE